MVKGELMTTALFLMAGVLVLMGVPMVLLGLVVGRRASTFNARALETRGIVIGHREHTSTSGSFNRRIYFPIVRYTTKAGQTLEANAPGDREPVGNGSPISLLYDPTSPDEVSFTGPRGSMGLAKVIGVMGGLLMVSGVVMAVAAAVVRLP